MKKISHESPLCLLEKSREYNDYDYCLVHLLDQYPEYYRFFSESLKYEREVVLDNSIFELGVAFNSERFAKWIQRLHPTYYIIPDVLENMKKTVDQFQDWIKRYSYLPGKKIGVVQGKSLDEIVYCYQAIEPQCDKVAISFDYSFYRELFPHSNEIVSWSMGRVLMINRLLSLGVINTEKPHHLLGCASPNEFIFYRDSIYDFIDSIDTSNPIVHGILGVKYPQYGLWEKKRIKLVDLLSHNVTNQERELIEYNIKWFKEIVNGN